MELTLQVTTLKSIFQEQGDENPRIIIHNSYCVLKGFNKSSREIIKKALTYKNQEAIYEIQRLQKILAMSARYKRYNRIPALKAQIEQLQRSIEVCWLKGDQFPTGHLKLVTAALNEGSVNYELEDQRENQVPQVNIPWKGTAPEPRYYQKEMLEIGLREHRGVFEACVGSGKTLVMQLLVHRISVPALIIAPSKDLSVQTYESFKDVFGKASVELVGSQGPKSKSPIRICTIQALAAALKKKELPKILKGIGMVCVDEAHHTGSKSYTDLLPYFDHIYFRFGFSGSYLRNDSKTLDMWGFLSTVLYKYSAAQATKEGYLTPLEVVVHEVDGSRGNAYQTEYNRNYCGNPALLSAIKGIVENAGEGEQVLILVGRKEKSGGVIHQYLKRLGVSNRYVSGDSKREDVRSALEDFNAKKFRVLVGSTIIGEGIDVRSTDHLIMAQGGKSEIAITQAVGRAVRLYPGKKTAYLHDFRFTGTKYLEGHLDVRLTIYTRNFDGKIHAEG